MTRPRIIIEPHPKLRITIEVDSLTDLPSRSFQCLQDLALLMQDAEQGAIERQAFTNVTTPKVK